MSVKLTYNTKKDVIIMIHKGKSVAFLDPKDFNSLIHEVKRIMEEGSPEIKSLSEEKKAERKRKAAQIKAINEFKIFVAINFIDFFRKIVRAYYSVIRFFKKK